MYQPVYRTKANRVPILSKRDISKIGEEFVKDFQPEAITRPQPVDVEAFLELYLGMNIDYQYLSHNGVYLGMTVFNDTDKVIIFSDETQRAEYLRAKAGTVIIDRRLLAEQQKHRLRFTFGHECGHGIFHAQYFQANARRIQGRYHYVPIVQCRTDTMSRRASVTRWTDKDWMEWQANCFASALLMPASAVKLVADQSSGDCRRSVLARFELVKNVREVFDVSKDAAVYRLKDLGYIPKDDDVNYITGSVFQLMTISAP